ncbi:MAG: hydrolase protein [Candidatus Dependentiae bacterium]|nr:hydrolase protein [Candidatus Dependentiae bacterium]
MFLVGILLLLCSSWWPLQIGFLSIAGVAWCLWFYPRFWQEGAVGCVILWSGHLYWIVPFINKELSASLSGSYCLGVGLLVYFILTTCFFWWALWRLTAAYLLHPCVRGVIINSLYMWWACVGSLPFLHCTPGYIFINPALPVLMWGRSCISGEILPAQWQRCRVGSEVFWFYYLPPETVGTRLILAQKIYKKLFAVPPAPDDGVAIIASPESSFPYPIYKDSEEFELWQSALPAGATWIFGGVQKRGSRVVQTLFYLNSSLITERYEKRNLVDFFEAPPRGLLQKCLVAVFSFKFSEFISGKNDGPDRAPNLQPALCSDLFCLNSDEKRGALLAANEEWLPDFVKLLWQGYGLYWSLTRRRGLVWVGRRGCWATKPFRPHTRVGQ